MNKKWLVWGSALLAGYLVGQKVILEEIPALDVCYPEEGPMNIAHRGAREQAPENTLVAFSLAHELGADGVELDTQLTSDGEIVIIHNQTVDKTTNGFGEVRHLTLDQIKSLDAGSWFDRRFANLRIPTLEEVIAVLDAKMVINIELKTFGLNNGDLAQKIVNLVHRKEIAQRVIISSFNPLELIKVRRMAPSLHTGLIYAANSPWLLTKAGLRSVLGTGLSTALRPAALHPHRRLVTPSFMRWAHDQSYRVNTWTVNEPAEMQRMIRLGVDTIMTDRPDNLHRIHSRSARTREPGL